LDRGVVRADPNLLTCEVAFADEREGPLAEDTLDCAAVCEGGVRDEFTGDGFDGPETIFPVHLAQYAGDFGPQRHARVPCVPNCRAEASGAVVRGDDKADYAFNHCLRPFFPEGKAGACRPF